MPSVESRLAPGEVHLWQIHLLGSDDEIRWGRSVLSVDEIQRADRYYFERHRRSFIVARAALRKILATYVGVLPQDIVFAYGVKGKPNLASGLAGSGLNFNLSHSEDYALLAVTQRSCLGVDIEFIDHERASEEIAARFFSPGEVDTLRAVPVGERAEAFFSCWTRKEAYIKAVGDGLSIPLDSFDVAFGPGVEPALLRAHAPVYEHWRLYNILAPAGYAAALVIEGEKHELRYLKFK